MNKAVLCLSIWCWAAAAYAQDNPGVAASAPTETQKLAAASLVKSAQSLVYDTHQTPARAGRLVVLSKYADRLDPCSPVINALLAGIYQSQDKPAETARALGVCLQNSGQDYLLALRWIRLSLDTLQNASLRIQFLSGLAQRKDLSDAIRAEALVNLARVLKGQGEEIPHRHAYEEALRLDPYNPAAVNGVLAFKSDPTPVDRIGGMLAILRGNPRNTELAMAPAALLGELGLHANALTFYDYVWELAGQGNDPEAAQAPLILPYCNALLDAGQFRKASVILKPALDRASGSADLRSLLIETYRGMGEESKSKELIADMESTLKNRESGSTTAPTLAYNRDLAWFYLLTMPKPKEALALAREAFRQEPDDPVIQRILGVAELGSEKAADGEKRLVPLARGDVYAALFLARYYLDHNNVARGRQVLLQGATISRSGPAYRQLAAMAAKYAVELPPLKGSAEARQLVEQFDMRYLELGLAPEKFIKLELKAVKDRVLPCEPVEIRVVLSNVGAIDLPLGEWGIVDPQMSLSVMLPGVKDAFVNLPIGDWPAPRYLAPGQSIQTTIDINTGEVQDFLSSRPVEDLRVVVSGVLNPVQYGEKFYSSLPKVAITPATIIRTNLLNDFNPDKLEDWKQAYEQTLGVMLHNLRHGTEAQKMLTARQISSLLLMASRWEQNRLEIQRPLTTVISRPVLLSMMREAMKDRQPVVRAQMLAAMQDVPLTDKALSLLADWVQDPSPLVRMRMAELLGASGLPGQSPVLEFLASDADENVRAMASLFLKPKKK